MCQLKYSSNVLEFCLSVSVHTLLIPMLLLLQDPGRLPSELTSESNAGPQLVIWGTDVVVSLCKDKFKRFIESFIDPEIEADEKFEGMDIDEPLYLQKLEEVFVA